MESSEFGRNSLSDRLAADRISTDTEYGHAHQYDLHCVACVNRESVLKKRSTEIPLHSKPILQAALEKSVDELKSVQLRRSKKNKLK